MYMPTLARFTARDPLGEDEAVLLDRNLPSLQPYIYAANNPVRFVDPSGLFPLLLAGPITPPKDNDEGCTGLCIRGKNVVITKCTITKLKVLKGSDTTCKIITKGRVCSQLTETMKALNKKFPQGWISDYCNAGCQCDPAGGNRLPGKQTVVLKDFTIKRTGTIVIPPFGLKVTITCKLKIDGKLEVKGGGINLLACKKKKRC